MRYPLLVLHLLLAVSLMRAQSGFPSYYSLTDLAFGSPGALKAGLYGYDNPALLNWLHQSDLYFTWTDAAGRWHDFNRWGLFVAVPHLGFGAVKTKLPGASVTDYRVSLGFGERAVSMGFAFGWAGGESVAFGRSNVWTAGTLVRPNPYVSVGLVGSVAPSKDGSEAVAEIALRPLGDELVTFFGDYGVNDRVTLGRGPWSVGGVLEALPGLRIFGRYFETKSFAVGIELSFGRQGVAAQTTFPRGSARHLTTYAVRLGAYDRTILEKIFRKSRYLQLDLAGPLQYRRFVLFDNSQTLSATLRAIDAAEEDESVAGIAVSTSGMRAPREMLWEVRERLKQFRQAGKRVVVFVDRPSIDEYHFASVADRIVLDPAGMILLQGFVSGRTFLKGSLEKLGIGFEEFRYFKYKSANETYSRVAMSEADREQRQELVHDRYALAKQEIVEARRMTPERFDDLVNDDLLFLPQEALAAGLVDTLGRWDEVEKIVAMTEGEKKSMAAESSLLRFNCPEDNYWGPKPRIAVIYALGVCDMDEGIAARRLIKDLDAATKDHRVKAIVLRVDSPGGEPIAADYIAEGVIRARKAKPVIVSQGAVAASGGYILSMHADTIVAAPNTITGSIGVTGGWFYGKDLKDKLGLSTDRVQAGRHADLGFGLTLPLLGIGLPDRNLSNEERGKVEKAIRALYAGFVQKVAGGRGMNKETVDSLGQGRVWSGMDAKTNGLVDLLGGLDMAIRVARERAGITAGEPVDIVEMPPPGLINWSALIPSPFRVEERRVDAVLEHLRFRLRHNGEPLPVMPLEETEFEGR